MSDDNLIKPVLGTDPDPLMVSTFAEPSYATLTLAYGKEKAAGASWPIECSKLVISIPTGRQATALTGDPQRINPSTGIITAGNGKKWSIAKDSTDPNRTDYTLVPDDDATFDGTWQLNVELSGIEVNGAIGPVRLGLTEKTKTSGGEFTERTGHVEVVKRDDAFSFHSLRPKDTVIARGGTVQLNWEGSSNAEYTVYFRDKDGDHEKPLPNPGGTWTSPALVDATNFTLKATLGDKDLYQTTHVRVAEPDLRVNTLGVADKVVSDLVVEAGQTLKTSTLSANGSEIDLVSSLAQSGSTSISTGSGGLTANGDLKVTGTLTAEGNVEAIESGKMVRIGDLRGPSGETLVINSNTELQDGSTLKTNSLTVTGDLEATSSGKMVRIGDLRGPFNKTLVINSNTELRDGTTLTIPEDGKLVVEGVTDLVGELQSFTLNHGTTRKFTAPSSGLAVGIVKGAGGSRNPLIQLVSGGESVEATARRHNGPSGNAYGTTVLPVAKGATCEVVFTDSGGDSGSDYKYAWLFWIPFGKGDIDLSAALAESNVLGEHEEAESEPVD